MNEKDSPDKEICQGKFQFTEDATYISMENEE